MRPPPPSSTTRRLASLLACATLVPLACVGGEPDVERAPAEEDFGPRIPLTLDIVLSSGAVRVHARQPRAAPGCSYATFPGPGACAQGGDVPCTHDPTTIASAPCIERLVLLEGPERNERVFEITSDLAFASFAERDQAGREVALRIEGCGAPREIAFPTHRLDAPAIEAAWAEGVDVAVSLDRETTIVDSRDGGLTRSRCGTGPADEVQVGPIPDVSRWIQAMDPLAVVEGDFGVARFHQAHRDVSEVRSVGDPIADGYLLPILGAWSSLGYVHLATIDARGQIFLVLGEWWPSPELPIQQARVFLGVDVHEIELDLNDGRTMLASRPAREHGGRLDRFEGFSVHWLEDVELEDASGSGERMPYTIALGLTTSTAVASAVDW